MIGLFLPTFGRPDFIRSSLLQLTAQSVKPNIVVVHENGNKESYKFIIEDIQWPFEIIWNYNPNVIKQHYWYSIPLQQLIERNCDYYFWIDHDDIYHSHHIETSINELQNYDFRISAYAKQLTVDRDKYNIKGPFKFVSHAPGGVSSSMAFNKEFAKELLNDLNNDKSYYYADNVVAYKTMPKFRCLHSEVCTTTYLCHKGSKTSSRWVKSILSKPSI